MSVLKTKAQEIASRIKSPHPQFAISSIFAIISIIIGIIQIYQKCNKSNKQIVDALQDPSYADKIVLRRKLRQASRTGHLNSTDLKDIEVGFQEVGKALTQEELGDICTEIKEGVK